SLCQTNRFILHHNEMRRVYFQQMEDLNHKIVHIMNTGHVTETVQTVIVEQKKYIHIRRYKIAKDFAHKLQILHTCGHKKQRYLKNKSVLNKSCMNVK
ncbi:hypothetical protein ACJX0J_007619, partial [Zea mays]